MNILKGFMSLSFIIVNEDETRNIVGGIIPHAIHVSTEFPIKFGMCHWLRLHLMQSINGISSMKRCRALKIGPVHIFP